MLQYFKQFMLLAFVVACAAMVWLAKHPFELYRERPLPNFTLAMLEGEPLQSDSWRDGKPYVINFFASWCGSCRQEMPEIAKLAQAIPVYGVAVQDSADKVKQLLEAKGNPFKAVVVDASGDMLRALELRGLPTTLVLDGRGQISFVQEGAIKPGEAEAKLIPLAKHVF